MNRTEYHNAIRDLLALEVDVLPIDLLEPDIAYGMFFDHQRMPPPWATGDYMDMYYRDMAEHGMNSVTFYATSGSTNSG